VTLFPVAATPLSGPVWVPENDFSGPNFIFARYLIFNDQNSVRKCNVGHRKQLTHPATVIGNTWQGRVIQEILGKDLVDQLYILPVLNFFDHEIDKITVGIRHASTCPGLLRRQPDILSQALRTSALSRRLSVAL
jgi:hypothetical protein